MEGWRGSTLARDTGPSRSLLFFKSTFASSLELVVFFVLRVPVIMPVVFLGGFAYKMPHCGHSSYFFFFFFFPSQLNFRYFFFLSSAFSAQP